MITYPLNEIQYNAEDAELFHCTRNSGIYAGTDFQYSVTGADNNITVSTGIAWIKNTEFSGKVTANKSAVVLNLGLADASLPRWDVVCIQFNKTSNSTDIVVKKGTASSALKLPEISQTETLYELYICKVYRKVGAVSITNADITDLRLDPTVCGLMADSVTSIDTSAINAQITALIEKLRQEIADVESGTEIMLKSVYDTDGSGIVDDSEKLGGQLPEYYATAEAVAAAQNTADNAMPKSGGTFTGEVYSSNMTHHPAIGCFRNIEVWQGEQQVSTGLIHMDRK